MKPEFTKALAKAAQAAQMFRDDLADVYKRTETLAEEMVFSDLLKQVNEINCKLARLNEEALKSNEYLVLVEKVRAIDESAAEYMLNKAYKLENFSSSHRLFNCFSWSLTPQGHNFWSEISKKLKE